MNLEIFPIRSRGVPRVNPSLQMKYGIPFTKLNQWCITDTSIVFVHAGIIILEHVVDLEQSRLLKNDLSFM